MQYLFSAPPNPYILGTVEAVLDLNERVGEDARAKLRKITNYFTDGLQKAGYPASNHLEQPVVFVEIGSLPNLIHAARFLWERGIVAGLRAFPVVPENKCGMRFALSALHTRAHVDQAIDAFEQLKKSLPAIRVEVA